MVAISELNRARPSPITPTRRKAHHRFLMKSNNPAEKEARRLEWEEDDRRTAEFERQRAELRDEIKRERRALNMLIEEAEGWQQAKTIRAYLAAIKVQARSGRAIEGGAEWIAWASDQADRLDPLRPTPPSVLDTPPDQYRAPGLNEYLDEEGTIRPA
jgi:hypothetical protein